MSLGPGLDAGGGVRVIQQRHVYVLGTKVLWCPSDTTFYDPLEHHFIPGLNRDYILKLFNNRVMMIENLLLTHFLM